jgi:hypothetical protein
MLHKHLVVSLDSSGDWVSLALCAGYKLWLRFWLRFWCVLLQGSTMWPTCWKTFTELRAEHNASGCQPHLSSWRRYSWAPPAISGGGTMLHIQYYQTSAATGAFVCILSFHRQPCRPAACNHFGHPRAGMTCPCVVVNARSHIGPPWRKTLPVTVLNN